MIVPSQVLVQSIQQILMVTGWVDVIGSSQTLEDVAWWDVMGHYSAGTLESSILDAGTVDTWQLFSSSEEEPTGTSVGFQFRSSDDSANMGAWSDTAFAATTDLSAILANSTDFVQYRAILQTDDPTQTPALSDITVTYTIDVSIDEYNNGEIFFWNLTAVSNPSFGNCAVQVSVPQGGVLHDVTGRVIANYSQELEDDTHSVSFNNLAP